MSPNLSGLVHIATDVDKATAGETFATGVARYGALVDGTHAYGWSDLRAAIGSATFAAYAGLFQTGGEVSLYDYLAAKMGAFRVTNRVPAVADTAQVGVVVLGAGPAPVRMYVWSALEVVRDPYSGAGAGKVTLTATALVSDVYAPYSTAQVKQVHPQLS